MRHRKAEVGELQGLHGADGNAPTGLIFALAGQHYDYLLKASGL